MQRSPAQSAFRKRRLRRLAALGCVWLPLLSPACQLTRPSNEQIQASDNGSPVDPSLRSESAAVFARLSVDPEAGAASLLDPAQTVVDLAVLHIQVPSESRTGLRVLWQNVREDILPADTQMQLQRNGLRVGVGHVELWEPIRAALSEVTGHRVTLSQPVRVPRAFPLALELETGPRDQTLFCMEKDGVLNGESWPNSRNALLVTYAPEHGPAGEAHLEIVPEVRQQLAGLRYVRTESGIWEAPRRNTRRFDSVAVVLSLRPDEFAMIGPNENADVYGLLGGALLTGELGDTRYDSYIILRPELQRVD
jgi:hypothetical protein